MLCQGALAGLLEDEAEEEEEAGLQGGLGDFGFGVPGLRADDEEGVRVRLLSLFESCVQYR